MQTRTMKIYLESSARYLKRFLRQKNEQKKLETVFRSKQKEKINIDVNHNMKRKEKINQLSFLYSKNLIISF